ncbi:MAG TPA: hypothetical protein VES36_07845 [Candidatus Limnocylindrales bacterium]|nr:hypothetical protein [Candidatus Limnocylindrales bacterium]
MVIPIAGHVGAHQPPTVQLKAVCPHAFLIGRLGRPTRWFREVGYTTPILAQDRDFDERWSVEARDHEFAQALVREREARTAITKLHELGCVALSHDGRKLTAVLGDRPKDKAEREQHEQAVRAQLTALAAVTARLCRLRSFPHNGGSLRLAIISILLGLALAAGATGLALGGDELLGGELGWLTLKSLLVSVPLTLVLIGAVSHLLAGRSTSHKELGLVVLLAVLGVPTLGVGAAVTINRTFDTAIPSVHRLPVLELYDRRGDGNHVTHYAVVPAWREDRGPTQRLKLGKRMAAQAVAGQSWLRLTTSPGKLNAERLLDLRLETDDTGR